MEEKRINKLAVVSFVIPILIIISWGILGVVGILGVNVDSDLILPTLFIIFPILALVSIIFGITAILKIKKNGGKGKIFIFLGWLISVPGLVFLVFMGVMLGGVGHLL